jgi:uncharacterized membrane protein
MTKGRLEAFSDGVLAIIITIMVLELKVPEGNSCQSPVTSKFQSLFFSYLTNGNASISPIWAERKVNGIFL